MNKSLAVALFLIISGATFSILSLDYRIGTPDYMGPGFFPFVVGLIVVGIGATFLLDSIKDKTRVSANYGVGIKLLASICGSVVVFKYTGMLVAVLFLVWTSALIHPRFNIKQTLYLSAAVGVLTVAMKYGLMETMPLW